MMSKNMGMMLVLLCLVGAASAESVLWVSSNATRDQGFIDLLTGQGYTVDRLENAAAMDAVKRDLANTYDLVIIGRDLDSGAYASNADEVALWNSITAPILNMNGYLWRSSRWKWMNTSGTADTSVMIMADLPADPIFNGVELDENNRTTVVTSNTTIAASADAGNGTVVAHRDNAGQPYVWIARWNADVEYYSGSGQLAGGPRMAFGGGHADNQVSGAMNLSAPGTTLFLNAVYEMSGATFDRAPVVDGGGGFIARANTTVSPMASVYDPDGTVSIAWSKLSGPGTVVFDDPTVLNPNITFDAKGTYTLEIAVSDTANTVSDEITVIVRDPADDGLVAHWDFESLPDPNMLVDVSGNGYTGVFYRTSGTDPNVAAGNMIAGSQAADLTAGDAYWEIPNSYSSTGEPNFADLATGMTVAAWVKISDSSINAPVIVGNGLDGWRFGVNIGFFNFVCLDIGFDLNGPSAYDGQWHHVVGVFDGYNSQGLIYVDGEQRASAAIPRGTLLSRGDDYPHLQVGNRGDADRPWKGMIDDIQIYNYPLTAEEIETLASEGDRQLRVSAGEDQTIAYKGTPIQLDASVLVDDSYPAAATLAWTVAEVPAGASAEQVIFSDASAEDPTVTFPNKGGVYTLNLTADDTVSPVTDAVRIEIIIPTCADVIADGLTLLTDVSGPDGEPDCRVDINDFAAMAADWLRCNDPEDAACEWAYQQ